MNKMNVISTASKIKEIFKTMDYGPVEENLDVAMDWIKNHSFGPIPRHDVDVKEINIMNILNNEILSPCFITASVSNLHQKRPTSKFIFTQTKISIMMNKMVALIKSNTDLFSQLNLITKGVLRKHTESIDIPIMLDYFQYYANQATLYNDQDKLQAAGEVGLVLNEDTQLCTFAMAVAPIIAVDGNSLHICTEPQLIPIIQLFVELFVAAGFGNQIDVIVVDGSDPTIKKEFVKSPNLKNLIQIGNLDENKTMRELTAGLSKNLFVLTTSKSSMLVFNDADLDSACNVSANTAWSHSGKLPWSLSTILVQEDVHDRFIQKLKDRISKLISNSSKSKLIDVFINSNTIDKLKKFKKRAKHFGIETCDISINKQMVPVLAIDGLVDMNGVITDDAGLPVITVLPFRKAAEAISLANNTRYGLAASVWSENVSLISEVSRALQVGIVWVNCHGHIDASVSLCPQKQSGLGYFGGKDGLILSTIPKDHIFGNPFDSTKSSVGYSDWESSTESESDVLIRKDVRNKVDAAKKAFSAWASMQPSQRTSSLRKLADSLPPRKGEEESYNLLKNELYKWAGRSQENKSRYFSTTVYDPLGVIAIDCSWSVPSIVRVCAAIANGNAVIIVTKDNKYSEITKLLSGSGIPSGLIIVVGSKTATVKTLVGHQDIQAFFVELQNNVMNDNRAYYIEKYSQYNLKHTSVYVDDNKIVFVDILKLITTTSKQIVLYPGNSF